MKINQNKSNHFLKKLCAKSFINTKKEDTLFNKTNKKLERRYFLKTSSSTKRNLRKDDSSERYNTLRENFKNRKMMNQDLLKTDEHIINNKKRSVILNKINNNLNKKIEILKEKSRIKENQNKSFENKNDNDSKVNQNNSFYNTIMINYKNSSVVTHNKTINHIRIQNSKLNTVLYNKEKKNSKEKTSNFCLPIRIYNSLNKSNDNDKNVKISINKSNNKSSSKRINNSFRTKETNNKSIENAKLKIKLKQNKSIEKGYINFYKVDKNHFKYKTNEKKQNLNKTLIPSFTSPLDTQSDISCNTERDNKINTISSTIQISINGKEIKNEKDENKEKKIKQLNLDIMKIKLDNLKNALLNEVKTERETNDKPKTSFLPSSSKSIRKRKKIKNETDIPKDKDITKDQKMVIKKIVNKKIKHPIKKRNENLILNKQYNTEIINNDKNIKFNKINNNNKTNKENNKINNSIETDKVDIINEDSNSLHNNNSNNIEIFDSDGNKKNYEIFEIISDVKVKSFTEYEEDKKNSLNKNQNNKVYDNKNEINKNININEIFDQNTFEHKSIRSTIINQEKIENENFIEDRDEYNIKLKETFSKDRFSFRPTNNDSNETFQDSKVESNKTLDKKDFINSRINSFSSFKVDNSQKKISIGKKEKQIKNIGINIDKNKNLVKSKSKELKNEKK